MVMLMVLACGFASHRRPVRCMRTEMTMNAQQRGPIYRIMVQKVDTPAPAFLPQMHGVTQVHDRFGQASRDSLLVLQFYATSEEYLGTPEAKRHNTRRRFSMAKGRKMTAPCAPYPTTTRLFCQSLTHRA